MLVLRARPKLETRNPKLFVVGQRPTTKNYLLYNSTISCSLTGN